MPEKRETNISPLVEMQMPNASLEEKLVAQEKLRAFLKALISLNRSVQSRKENDSHGRGDMGTKDDNTP
ncbi:hypothetical protein HCH_06390 [Hahella chejuensis KCTC 2396]|uniref:Uncharacterized protein n=1 Tax=Hahella chejuensis (strain KCTC 2396) TaxID=349521 RepID=Q2S8I9_HAHCH|nr:hypothetical protein [Hahella chejuensis]ABC33035.1 hypothetical protein HCH_06390 [Hahella chejuensis KCTC 2396]